MVKFTRAPIANPTMFGVFGDMSFAYVAKKRVLFWVIKHFNLLLIVNFECESFLIHSLVSSVSNGDPIDKNGEKEYDTQVDGDTENKKGH